MNLIVCEILLNLSVKILSGIHHYKGQTSFEYVKHIFTFDHIQALYVKFRQC